MSHNPKELENTYPFFTVECSCNDIWLMELTEAQYKEILHNQVAVFSYMDQGAQVSLKKFIDTHRLFQHKWRTMNLVRYACSPIHGQARTLC